MENTKWDIFLENKPDFEMAMKRIYAWFEHEMIDRPPIRFSAHNSQYSAPPSLRKEWPSRKYRWFDAEYQVDLFIDSIKNVKYHAETFPVFCPNLGPEVYSAFHGSELEFMEVTSYSIPLVKEWEDISKIRFDRDNPYLKKIDEMTKLAIEKSAGRFLVGYTDLHPGVDCAAAWRDPPQFCMDLLMDPEGVKRLIRIANENFLEVFDHFDSVLKKHKQPSVTWMEIPSFGRMYIPSCDFAAMISGEHFEEFCLAPIKEEIRTMTHNVFHLDGKGVARHVRHILEMPKINAIQWVQGVGDDFPIMQWVPFIKEIQAAGKSLVLDIQLHELEDFIGAMDSKGLFLCIPADQSLQADIIKRIEKW